jgi:hypothetical protein
MIYYVLYLLISDSIWNWIYSSLLISILILHLSFIIFSPNFGNIRQTIVDHKSKKDGPYLIIFIILFHIFPQYTTRFHNSYDYAIVDQMLFYHYLNPFKDEIISLIITRLVLLYILIGFVLDEFFSVSTTLTFVNRFTFFLVLLVHSTILTIFWLQSPHEIFTNDETSTISISLSWFFYITTLVIFYLGYYLIQILTAKNKNSTLELYPDYLESKEI